MGYSALPSSSAAVRALSAYEARRLAKLLAGGAGSDGSMKYNCFRVIVRSHRFFSLGHTHELWHSHG